MKTWYGIKFKKYFIDGKNYSYAVSEEMKGSHQGKRL